MKNTVVGWFEIPVHDIDRAVKFYEAVFGFEMQRKKLGPLDMAWFPTVEGGMGSEGSLVHAPGFFAPSSDGTLVYFTAPSGDLSIELVPSQLSFTTNKRAQCALQHERICW